MHYIGHSYELIQTSLFASACFWSRSALIQYNGSFVIYATSAEYIMTLETDRVSIGRSFARRSTVRRARWRCADCERLATRAVFAARDRYWWRSTLKTTGSEIIAVGKGRRLIHFAHIDITWQNSAVSLCHPDALYPECLLERCNHKQYHIVYTYKVQIPDVYRKTTSQRHQDTTIKNTSDVASPLYQQQQYMTTWLCLTTYEGQEAMPRWCRNQERSSRPSRKSRNRSTILVESQK